MKNFKLFEKLWEHGRTLRRVGLVLVMCLITITQMWAWTPIYFNGNFTGNNWNGATYQINYELEESNSGHYFYPFYNGSTGDKYWRLYAEKDYVNYQLSPSSNNYVQDVGTVGYKVTCYKDWKDYNFKTTNAKVGVIAVHINQGDGNGDLTPGTWLERPTIYIWHNWGGNTSNWGNNGGSGQKSMTDKEDGTYTYDGVYSASGTNVGIEGTGPIKKYFADNATTLVGSPASGNKCRFTWNSNGYKGYDVETNNRGSLTITKLCQITYNGNGKTGGSVPSNQNDIMYNTTTTVRGNTGTLVKTNYVFTGWNANDSGTGAHYDAGTGTINPTAVTTTLYAEWQDEWNLKGSWDDWANYKGMPNVSSNTFQVTLSLAANTTYEFKVVQRQASGDTYYGKTSTLFTRDNLTSVKNLSTAGATPNMQIRTDVAGDYTFTFIKDGSASNMRVLVKYPCATAGKTLFKFTTKSSGLGTGNVCASSNVDKVSTTNDDLSALAGGTLTARSEGSNNRLKYAESAFTFDNGDRGVLRIDLDCPLQTGDVIRYINSANNASYNAYIRHTSSSTATDQLTLPGLNASIAEVVVPSGFNNKSTIYVTRGSSNGALISHIEIIRPYVVTLDASTNGGQVNGNNTEVHYMLASESLVLPHADKTNYRFKGWYTTYNGSTSPSNPYTPTANATLYAQFEDCPSSDATVYKFQLKTTLSNEAAFSGVTGDYETDVTNYLSTLIGGTLLTHQYGSNLTIVSKSKFQFGSNNEYLKVDLDCALETSDKFITTIANDELCVTTSSTRDNTYKLYTGSSTTADIPAAFVGAKTLYIWRDGTNPQISYFEVYRPAKYTITYEKGSADGASGDSFTGTKIHEVDFTLSSADNAFTRTGYTYDGWSTSADGSTDDYELGGTYSTDDDITLYPHWVADVATYSITYECYSATSGCPSNASEQTALPDPLPSAPTKNGYTFGGWYTDDTFETSAVAGATLSDDVTLYAKWTCTTPTFSAQPSSATVCKDASSPSLGVTASANGGSLSYQWYVNTTKTATISNDLKISGATSSTYSAPTGTAETKYYYCVVTNTTGGCSATSDIATVTVKGAATITWGTQPSDGTVGDDDFAYAVSCSDGSTVTVTSNNTSYGTIVDGKLHYVAAGTTYLIATATDACGNKIVQNSNNFTVSAALSSEKKLLGLKFSNGFDAFIDETYHTVTAYYLYGTSAPTVSSHTESDDATYSKEGNTITITAEDGTTQDYTLTLSTVTPYAGTGSEETFTGSEAYIKGGIWEDSEWNIRKNSNDDDRQQKGLNRLYFFIDECSTITLTSSCGNSRNIYVYRNGTKLDSPTSIGTSGATIEIAGSASPALYAILPNGTNGDIEMNKIMITPNCTSPGVLSVVPNTGHNGAGSYQYGDDIILTASCADGTNASTTYAWYKGADWLTAKAAGAIQSAKTAVAGGTIYTKSAELSDAGTYWCEASNGSGCETHNLLGTDISVGKAAFTPDLNYESLPIPVGSTRDPVLTGVPDGAGAATYTSSDTDVAEVDSETGVVTAKAAGTATIRVDIAESSNYIDRYDTKTITVREAILYTVTFDPNGGEIDDSTDPVEMEQATEGAALTMPTPEHATYTFDGWYIADTEIGDEGAYTPTKNVTAYAKWIEECSGGGVSVEFTSSKKNDNGDYFANMSTSSNTTQMVGTGSAKLIAIGDATLSATSKKDGYRSESKMEMVFKFASSSTLDVYVTTGSTSRTYALYSFSSAKELSAIEAADYSSNTIVSSNVTATGATFANTTVKGTPSVSSGIITISGTAGGVKISYTNLSGYYVFKALGTSESYIYGFDINGGSSDCYRVNYHSNGADGGLTFDPQAYDEGDKPTVVANGFTFEHETEFLGWNTEEDGSGTMYQAGDKLSISDDDIDLYAQWMPINRFQATEDRYWNNEDNWSHGVLPSASHKVIIEKPCELRKVYLINPIAKVKSVVIDKYGDNTGQLTIVGPAGLAVEEMIMTKNAEGYFVGTSTTDLNIDSSSDHENGALAVKGYTEAGDVDLKATVTPKTKARVFGWSVAGEYIGFYVNQFIGTPMLDAKGSDYYGSWLYRWDATAPEDGPDAGKGDWVYASGALAPFQGYTLLFDNHDETYLWLRGTLVYSEDHTFDLAYDARHENLAGTETMLANSYLAPIDVTTMTTTDFAGGDEDKMEATIYVFNSGTPNNWSENEEKGKGNIGELPGQFLCMSINSAVYTGGITEISSMQAFSVYAKSTGATFNLDYERMVYNPLKNRVTGIAPMRAPSNKAAANDNAPDVMKIMVECEHGADKLFMLTREDFNAGFDNGWDARKMFGETFAPQLYAFTPDGNMSVNCVPDEEGAVLGFRKGSADDVYTISFTYNGEKMLYLNDTKEQLSTLINDDAEYTFVSETGDTEARFIISETPYNAPTVTTGFDGINAEQKAKVHKVLINDHIYIIRGGRMYDATGKKIK